MRVFFPSKLQNGNLVPQVGDTAVLGPGLGDTLRFNINPIATNDTDIYQLDGSGYLEFGIEGIRAGAQVRIQATVEFVPFVVDFATVAPGSGLTNSESATLFCEIAERTFSNGGPAKRSSWTLSVFHTPTSKRIRDQYDGCVVSNTL